MQLSFSRQIHKRCLEIPWMTSCTLATGGQYAIRKSTNSFEDSFRSEHFFCSCRSVQFITPLGTVAPFGTRVVTLFRGISFVVGIFVKMLSTRMVGHSLNRLCHVSVLGSTRQQQHQFLDFSQSKYRYLLLNSKK